MVSEDPDDNVGDEENQYHLLEDKKSNLADGLLVGDRPSLTSGNSSLDHIRHTHTDSITDFVRGESGSPVVGRMSLDL